MTEAGVETVVTRSAPTPIGAYSQGRISGGLVYVSGQAAVDPTDGSVITGSIENETHLAIDNIEAILVAAGSSLANVVKANVHLADLADFSAFDAVFRSRFPAPRPARTTVQSVLPKIKIEIDVVARIGGSFAPPSFGMLDRTIQPLAPSMKFQGPAVTIDVIESEDTVADSMDALARMVQDLPPGSVPVVAARPNGTAVWDAFFAAAARVGNVAGLVTDGHVSDPETIVALGFPVFASGARPFGQAGFNVRVGVPISCGGVRVSQGDTIIANEFGVTPRVALASDAVPGDRDIADLLAGLPFSDVWATRRSRFSHEQ